MWFFKMQMQRLPAGKTGSSLTRKGLSWIKLTWSWYFCTLALIVFCKCLSMLESTAVSFNLWGNRLNIVRDILPVFPGRWEPRYCQPRSILWCSWNIILITCWHIIKCWHATNLIYVSICLQMLRQWWMTMNELICQRRIGCALCKCKEICFRG